MRNIPIDDLFASTMRPIDPMLVQSALDLLIELRSQPTTKPDAAKLEDSVGECMRVYWKDGKAGDPILRKVISLSTPEKSVDYFQGTPATQQSTLPSTLEVACPLSCHNGDLSDSDEDDMDKLLLDLFDDSDYDSGDDDDFVPGQKSDEDNVALEVDDTFDNLLEHDTQSTQVTANTEVTTWTSSEVTAAPPVPARKKAGRPPGKGKRSSISTKRKGVKLGRQTYVANNTRRQKKQRPMMTRNTKVERQVAKEDISELSLSDHRLLISMCYIYALGAPEPSEWYGSGGTVGQIMSLLNLSKPGRKKVIHVMRQTYDCVKTGSRYTGHTRWSGGRQNFIQPGTEEENMIAQHKEEGCSFTQTMRFINDYRARNGETEPVTRSAVYSAYMNMSKIVTTINKRSQGNSDPESNWAKARYRWVTQLLIRLGYDVDVSDFEVDGKVEECFTKEALTGSMLNLDAIGWWDEVHKQCHIGDSREGATEHVQFPRDNNGRYNANGTFSEEARGVVLKVKYAEQVQKCLGVAELPAVDGEERKGVRILAFDYTGRKIVSISDFVKAEEAEIRRVKKLKLGDDGYSSWLESNREDGKVYLNDPIMKVGCKGRAGCFGFVDRFGMRTCQKLPTGYTTVADFLKLEGDEAGIKELANKVGGLKEHTIVKVSIRLTIWRIFISMRIFISIVIFTCVRSSKLVKTTWFQLSLSKLTTQPPLTHTRASMAKTGNKNCL